MCGIAGLLQLEGKPVQPAQLRRMADLLRHRGPDDEGFVFFNPATGAAQALKGPDSPAGVALPDIRAADPGALQPALGLAERRLAILDLSPAGHTPMRTPDGRLTIAFNGEIFNYLELRETLRGRGHTFATAGDTEVLLAAYREWGPACVHHPGYDPRLRLGEVFAAWPERPDVYLCLDPGAERYFPAGIEDLPIPTACWLGDIHLGAWRLEAARFFDTVFLPFTDYIEPYQRALGHAQVHWSPFYVSPRIQPLAGVERSYQVGFVGHVVRAHQPTPRARRLKLLAERYTLNPQGQYQTHAGLAEIYSRSQIVFNVTINGDLNLRVFEGAACGALVLTDSTANGLPQAYEVGKEIVVYASDQDLLEKVDYYLAHPAEREQIARAGQQRTWRDHTFARRAEDMAARLAAAPVRAAPMRAASAAQRCAARREIFTHLHLLDPLLDLGRAHGRRPWERLCDIAPGLARRLLF